MAYDPARMAAARAAIRWNYTLGSLRPAPVAPPPLEALDEVTLAALRRSLKAEPAPIPTATPKKPQPTEFRGALRTYSFFATTTAGIANSTAMVTEEISLPIIVRRVLMTTDATAETQADILVATALSVNPLEAEIRAGQRIYPDPSSGTGIDGIHNVAAGSTFTVPMDKVITQVPFRLVVYIENMDAGPHRLHAEITAQDLDPEDIRVISVPVILQPQVLRRSLSVAELPPPRGPAYPKAVRILVKMGTTPGYHRDVLWNELDPVMKRMWRDSGGAGEPPGTMQSLW